MQRFFLSEWMIPKKTFLIAIKLKRIEIKNTVIYLTLNCECYCIFFWSLFFIYFLSEIKKQTKNHFFFQFLISVLFRNFDVTISFTKMSWTSSWFGKNWLSINESFCCKKCYNFFNSFHDAGFTDTWYWNFKKNWIFIWPWKFYKSFTPTWILSSRIKICLFFCYLWWKGYCRFKICI